MGKQQTKSFISLSTQVENEPPFKKKQLIEMQVTQSNAQDIPLQTVLDDLPTQVTHAMMLPYKRLLMSHID